MQLTPRRWQGFTLVELAVVLAIVGLLLGSLMYTLSAQADQRAREQTQRSLEQAREALLGFAVANGRLPCPATAASNGAELPAGGGDCTAYDGFLPAVTLGFQPVDSDGFAIDAWNNRIRYTVARNLNVASCAGTSTVPHFTVSAALKQNGISCLPNPAELLVCKSSTGAAPGSCGAADNYITSAAPSGNVVAIVLSTGRNFASAPSAALASAGGRTDEAANLDGNTVFVSHTLAPSGAAGGEFDDMLTWIPVGVFYGRLVGAAVLP